ncbi:hypothetical protein COU91_01660 [Candidatus Saccharibacteria bacterium CG10_big_fil_rev_8_21_14_0_10_47_8]|nr:MAG: hypothetical protein COU91_01660 [Candidatus Saccharibacteria bacterium CG10_big_fil_rev_8_21_14_0_10_47_8]
MKRFGRRSELLLYLLIIGLVFLGGLRFAKADVNNFTISNFSADYYLSRDAAKASSLDVVEKIDAQFPNYDQNHGILRAIPRSYQGHTLSLKINSVKDDSGISLNYTTYTQNDNLVLKIGNPDRYVLGRQTYVVSYSMRNAVDFLNDHEELYWDVNGDQWAQPMAIVNTKIHIPSDLLSQLQDRQTCYAGFSGVSSSGTCSVSRDTNSTETVVSATASNLQPYQTLTFVLGFNKGTFLPGPEIAHEKLARKIKIIAAVTVITLLPLIAFIFMFSRWRRFGNDPRGRGVIVPQYTPPKGFNVLSGDFVLSQKMGQKTFSAAIMELAVKRYINIYETKQKKALRRDTTDYDLELIKDPSDLPSELKQVSDILFPTAKAGEKIKLADIKKSTVRSAELYEQMRKLEDSLASDLHIKGYFIKDPKKVRNGYRIWAGVIFFLSFVITFIAFSSVMWVSALGAGCVLAALVIFGFSFIMPARTEAGVQAHDDLLGLRDYIKLAEADRLKFLQSPEGAERISDPSEFNPKTPTEKIKLFEKLLPYAMLFGLEKDWAKQFNDLYTQPPDWYSGNWTTFNTVYLASSLNSFGSYSNTVFSSPSSSSGSGFSGGGAGGGGGGGGGGGW